MIKSITEEWIITNALGGYASNTVIGENTRRYHGLLVAAMEPPTNKKVILSKIEERVFLDGVYHDLSINEYPGATFPNGFQYLDNFEVVPFPLWTYKTAGWKLEKSIFMVQNSNTSLINYSNKGHKSIILELHPLYAFTDFHSTFHENSATNFYSEISSNTMKTFPKNGSMPIFTRWTEGEYIEERAWFKDIQLPLEKYRGLDDAADYYRIGYIRYELKPNESITLLFSVDDTVVNKDINSLLTTEKERVINSNTSFTNTFYKDLLRSGNQFIVNRKSTNSASIIAGYHWFSDWGRDTMISMRGLTIATNNKSVSKSILTTFFKYINQGMIPNRFPDNNEDEIEYNTIDASLWLFIAVYDYYNKFQDLDFIEENLNVLKEILDWHIHGTRYDIHVTPEGFLYGGQDGVMLTWMDAIVNGKIITPRIGCPVEINALWYNALKIFTEFNTILEIDSDQKYAHIISSFECNFEEFFLNSDGTLNDVIIPNGPTDASFRSNQIYCLSLPFSLLNQEQQIHIFEVIKSKLYTPFGLRTLEMENPEFKGIYQGNQWERDHAYHQGTVWPYIISEYYEVFFKLYGDSDENKRKVIEELIPLKKHFYSEQGLHCISEVFDGQNPQEGKGTIQQAWSISALIKLYTDYKLYEIEK
ncbi:amylo-alpha-1,6-glucosidase [Flavobacterium cellulosilyticum]|uniref:Glycogen debranching protein n=1 Tax=Flavobacterium cellulosilyticum TaxID=2541731 RepID=A0A4R5C8C0_9FLAO|nr:amylo-alpha-1,6-glucosidase [Flavobacterium cellulosilyticum]TDD94866.1 glycogen debranching protein [Flavobacterium cellulosilyticum]